METNARQQIQRILDNNMPHNPELKTEQDVVDKIDYVVNGLAGTFVFNEYTLEDVKQVGRLIALRALEGYDPEKKPLGNFLYVDMRRKYLNFYRDNYLKTKCPCKLCAGYPDGHSLHKDKQHCEEYKKWLKKTVRYQNVKYPLDITLVEKFREAEFESNVDIKDILEVIDELLPANMRKTYLQMRAGIAIPRKDKLVVEHIIFEIIEEQKDE
jgi:hypothetical protein